MNWLLSRLALSSGADSRGETEDAERRREMRITEINLLLAEISAPKKRSAETCEVWLPCDGLPENVSSFQGQAAPRELAQTV